MKPHSSSELIVIDPGIVFKAQDGDSFAQLDLGKQYFSAYYLESNCFVAFKWISLSAHQGNMEAQFRLADLYALGQGTEQSHTRAYEWYTKSAIQGYPKASIRIHNLYEDDKFMHCKGSQNNKEGEDCPFSILWDESKSTYIPEYRLQQFSLILNRAIEYYQQQLNSYLNSELEDQNIQLNLGFLYQCGYGTKKNIKLAIECYTTAANQDSVEAQFNLGVIYQKNDRIQDSNQKVFQWYSKAAENGSVAAGNHLGNLYEKGIGVKKNYSKALYWYTQAANKRYTDAQISVARMYRTGQGVAQDYKKAIQWYTIAAKEGSRVAQNCLDQIYSQESVIIKNENTNLLGHYNNPANQQRTCSLLREHVSEVTDAKVKESLERLAMNAMRGDIYAMYEIGLKYRDGVDLPQDRDLYVKWIKNSAKRGYLKAQYDIGKSYENGHDDEKNYHKASIWYRKGAKQKADLFQYHLGMMYFYGLGVREDRLEASRLFYKSAEEGDGDSQYQLGFMRLYGRGIRKNTSEAFDYLIKSANQRNCKAMYKVGRAYVEGELVKQDTVKGITWLRYALKYGSAFAGIQLLKIFPDYKDLLAGLDISQYFVGENFTGYESYSIAEQYLQGGIIEQDYVKAFHFYVNSRLEFQGDNNWFSTPASVNNINGVDLLNMYKYISEKGIQKLEYNIGYAYEYGIQDFRTYKKLLDSNMSKAIEWYTIASDMGDSRSQYRLGVIYEEGRGEIEKDILAAIGFYSKAVEKQNPDAMYRLAVLYLLGNNVPQDLVTTYDLFLNSHNMGHSYSRLFLKIPSNSGQLKPFTMMMVEGASSEEEDENELLYYSNEERSNRLAMQMLEAVADLGKISVQYQLGCLYEKDGDYSKAAYWFDRSLQGGITDAYYRLGVLYEEGLGIQKDYSRARTLYQKATEKKHDKALYSLARLYHYGIGTSVDYHKSFMLYKEAANEGNKPAQKMIGLLDAPKDYPMTEKSNREIHGLTNFEIETSLIMYEYLAKNGNTGLQFQLGQFYENSSFGTDYIKSVEWYSLAIDSYHADATYHLGKLYELGLGVAQDYTIAIKLYDKARELGCTKSTYCLGNIYQKGLGVDADYEVAFQYFTESSKKGNVDAYYKLGEMNDSADYRVKDTLKALKWYTKSYSQGNDNARHRLALFDDDDKPYEAYFHERLADILVKYMKIESDYTNMKEYIDPDMCARLSGLYFKGKGIEKNYKKAWHYLAMAVSLTFLAGKNLFRGSMLSRRIGNVIKENALKVHDIALQESENKDATCCIILGLMYLGGITLLQEQKENRENYISIFERKTDLGDESFHDKNSTTGSVIIPRDHKKAFMHFLKAAENGDDYCKLMVGQMYQCGYGVNQDFIKATNYYQSISAESRIYEYYAKQYLGLLYALGDNEGQDKDSAFNFLLGDGILLSYYFNTGQLYYYGYGINQNYKAALKYLTLASHLVDYDCLFLILRFKENMPNESSSKEQRVYSIVSHTTLKGEAEYLLGIMYREGQGVVKNSETALLKFKKSAECGSQKAQRRLNLYYSSLKN